MPRRVVICGGGVIGASIAYHLAARGVGATVVEGTGIACAASGKAGGFLALDWCDGSPLGPLARRSFRLHARLAARHGGAERWGYRRIDTSAVVASARRDRRGHRGRNPPAWLGERAVHRGRLGTSETTAQVHPALFTRAMMDLAAEIADARVVRARVVGIALGPDRAAVTGVRLDGGEVIDADAVVIAMGPWSVAACAWLPLPAVHGLKGNSVLFDTPASGPVLPHALFGEVEDEGGEAQAPEIFPRADGTTYVCGLSAEHPLPEDPAEVRPDLGAAARLRAIARAISPALGEAPILTEQACYRPITRDGLPLLGGVPGVAGAYVATGHSVWGILNGPASGEAMAGLIIDGRSDEVDLSPFDPARLPPLGADARRGYRRPVRELPEAR